MVVFVGNVLVVVLAGMNEGLTYLKHLASIVEVVVVTHTKMEGGEEGNFHSTLWYLA